MNEKTLMEDTAVGKALYGLELALKAAAMERGDTLHYAMVTVGLLAGVTAVSRFGCECEGCAKAGATAIMAQHAHSILRPRKPLVTR
jgi:hypothetical protein